VKASGPRGRGDGGLPADVRKALVRYAIDRQKCTGCGACLRACPHDAISGAKQEPHIIDREACTKCGICRDTCKSEAVVVR
jgi:formate hydrogenlyase subunit 6/NADH:ubiquinone oxidoreductase subunit I